MGQVRQGEVGEKGRLLLRVYSNCVALKGMLSRVYSPQVPWSYLDGVSCAAPVCLPSAGTQRDPLPLLSRDRSLMERTHDTTKSLTIHTYIHT